MSARVGGRSSGDAGPPAACASTSPANPSASDHTTATVPTSARHEIMPPLSQHAGFARGPLARHTCFARTSHFALRTPHSALSRSSIHPLGELWPLGLCEPGARTNGLDRLLERALGVRHLVRGEELLDFIRFAR